MIEGKLSTQVRFSWVKLVAILSRDLDHSDVGARIGDGGRLSAGYLMMIAISAAIAILGLLLSSPAVVIGAMLLSPLMGPIIALGFGFWTVDWQATRRAVTALVVGLGLALLVSMALVAVSPLKEPTAEILARSRPTLFDLLVAIFSGVAGGYAVVRQRGEAVIGVAIATALMPPLATVGFGVSTQAWNIAGGAALLFFTNLIAIALAAAAVAAFSGFRPDGQGKGRGWLHHVAVVAVLAVLCVPLTLSLRTIALESRATSLVRSQIAEVFGTKARIASLTVRSDGKLVSIDGLVAAPKIAEDANDRLRHTLQTRLGAQVRVRMDQLVLADPRQLAPTPAPAPGAPAPPDPVADLRAAVPFPGAVVLSGADGSTEVRLPSAGGLDLAGARALEQGLRSRPAFANVAVVPPVQPLPPIPLSAGDRHTPPMLGDASLQVWALSRWGAAAVSVQVCGTGGRPHPADLQPILQQAFAGRPVEIARGARGACAAAGAKPPFVIVAEGAPLVATGPTAPAG